MPIRTRTRPALACLVAGLAAAIAAGPGPAAGRQRGAAESVPDGRAAAAAPALPGAGPSGPRVPPAATLSPGEEAPGTRPAPAAAPAPPAPPVVIEGDAQRELALTVYSSDLGLVKDVREVRLPVGLRSVQFRDVAAGIDPTSVAVRSLLDPAAIAIVEQQYEFDLLTPQKLLEKFVGREVQLQVGGQLVTARLLALNDGPVYEIDGKIYLSPPGSPVLPSVPGKLVARPTLVWLLESRDGRPQRLEASYLTAGLSWKADYVVVLDKDDRRADVSAWVTLTNTSGATYRDAVLKLVAGDVHRAPKALRALDAAAPAASRAARLEETTFREEGFLEYHLYTLRGRTTVEDRQTKQVSLLAVRGVGVARRLVYYGASHFWHGPMGAPLADQKVGVFLEVDNRRARGLGLPLPRGIVRVFKADASGGLQLAGEDAIDHTPEDETLRIKLGEAFDVVGARRQVEWKRIGDRVYEVEWEVHLRNRKTTPETVQVVEAVPGDWELLRSSQAPEKPEAHTLRFEVPVPAGGERKVAYRVRFRW